MPFRNSLLLLLALALAGPALAQSNCPDPQASNYNPAATTNDGSCQYAATATALPTKATLPDALVETSGLAFAVGSLWSFNDSGNAPVLFRLDSASGKVVQQVTISNFSNVDWEDIAADAHYLYVGDVGNNLGNRRDLRILRVALADLGPAATTAPAEAIAFSYPDQTDFTPRNNKHDFDCEALFYANDSLHIFTKDWVDFQTRYYTVPATPGTYVAHLKGGFNVNGLVTAADLNPDGSAAALLGYDTRSGAAFTWLLSGFKNNDFLAANKRRIDLPSVLLVGQVEGFCFVGKYRALLSNEKVSNALVTIPPRLYGLSLGRWLAPATTLPTAAPTSVAVGIVATPNPAHQRLHLARSSGSAGAAVVSIGTVQGQEVLADTLPAGTAQQDVDLAGLEPGVYVLRITLAGRTHTQKLVVP